jgi:hypothetical protein
VLRNAEMLTDPFLRGLFNIAHQKRSFFEHFAAQLVNDRGSLIRRRRTATPVTSTRVGVPYRAAANVRPLRPLTSVAGVVGSRNEGREYFAVEAGKAESRLLRRSGSDQDEYREGSE